MEKSKFIKDIVPLRQKLLNYAFTFLKNEEESEDTTQEVLLKLYEMRAELHRYNSIQALSLTITKHLCLNKLRDSKDRYKTSYDIQITSNELNPYYKLEQKDEVKHVKCLIETLPTLQQAILKMRHIEGLEIQEISEILGSSPEAVRVNLSRARKQIINRFIKIEKQ